MTKAFYLITSLIVTAMALFYIWLRIEQVRYGYIISRQYEYLLELKRTNEKLKLEWSFLTSPINLQEIAQREFSMRPPKPQEIIFLSVSPSIFQNIYSSKTDETYGLELSCF